MCERVLASDRAVNQVASESTCKPHCQRIVMDATGGPKLGTRTSDAVATRTTSTTTRTTTRTTTMTVEMERVQRRTYESVRVSRQSSAVTTEMRAVVRDNTTGCCDDVACNDCCCERRTQNARGDERERTYALSLKGCDDKNKTCCRTISYRLDFDLKRTKFSCNIRLRLSSLVLVLLLAIASVQSAPTMTLENRRLNSAPKWMNPCGFAAEEFEGDLDVVQLNDATLLGNIIMQAKTALNYAQGFRDDYIKRTFNTDYADLHLTWKDNHYDWLPGPKQIPKQLGEQLEQEFLDKLEVRMLDTALLDAYEYMQRYAVGLEQIAWDQEDHSLEFRKQFKDTEYNLRSVLCELQMALAERGVVPRADVSREVMSSDYRVMSDATFRNLRDWIIFRDYMNGLEYIIQVLEHLVRAMES